MTKSLSSSELIATLEDVIWKQPERIAVLWTWGYELGQIEMHRWDAGRMYGYWLATPEEFPRVCDGFRQLCNAIGELEAVRQVDTSKYVVPPEDGWGGELLGEKWRITFAGSVAYDHRAMVE